MHTATCAMLRLNNVALESVHTANHRVFLIKHCCNAEEGIQSAAFALCEVAGNMLQT